MNLQSTFPILYSKCFPFVSKRWAKHPQILINVDSIVYDKSVISFVPQHQIDKFVEYQLQHPEIIELCFEYLKQILTQAEREIQNKSEVTKTKVPIQKIYEIIASTNICINQEMQDNFVLFLKSQNEFAMFF